MNAFIIAGCVCFCIGGLAILIAGPMSTAGFQATVLFGLVIVIMAVIE